MPRHSETRHLPYSPDQMFDMVADVARYDEFLPWVVAVRVRSSSEVETVADLVVGFIEATLATLRSTVGPWGQREVLLEELPRLQMPTLIVWGIEDRVLPYWQAQDALTRLQKGSLELIPNCGHLPHVEQPERFVSILDGFLRNEA